MPPLKLQKTFTALCGRTGRTWLPPALPTP